VRVTNNDVSQPSSSVTEHTNSVSHSSTAPAVLNTSTIQAANDKQHPQDHILPHLSGPPEVKSLGSDTDAAATCRVLMKDELKELLKTRNLAGPGINKSNKDGEYSIFHS
jgi:hypothetical protein